ncbi:unnamed protein product, partial [Didymodactylos carnosus]
ISIKSALLVIDVQYDFVNGSLAVNDANAIIPIINDLHKSDLFELVAFSQDWHCAEHVSFASSHSADTTGPALSPDDPRPPPFTSTCNLTYTQQGELCGYQKKYPSNGANCEHEDPTRLIKSYQRLWPDHCIENSFGARIVDEILINKERDIIIKKGTNCHIDSYSAFFDNNRLSQTQLHENFLDAGITDVYVVGLAFDYCVFYSAMDARTLNYTVYVVKDAIKGIEEHGIRYATRKMQKHGIHLINSSQLLSPSKKSDAPNHTDDL